jgi:hypothetical protein
VNCKNSVLNSLMFRELYFRVIVLSYSFSSCCCVCCCCANLKSILGVGPRVKDSIEDPFKLETWLGAFVLGYTSEFKVRPLHKVM